MYKVFFLFFGIILFLSTYQIKAQNIYSSAAQLSMFDIDVVQEIKDSLRLIEDGWQVCDSATKFGVDFEDVRKILKFMINPLNKEYLISDIKINKFASFYAWYLKNYTQNRTGLRKKLNNAIRLNRQYIDSEKINRENAMKWLENLQNNKKEKLKQNTNQITTLSNELNQPNIINSIDIKNSIDSLKLLEIQINSEIEKLKEQYDKLKAVSKNPEVPDSIKKDLFKVIGDSYQKLNDEIITNDKYDNQNQMKVIIENKIENTIQNDANLINSSNKFQSGLIDAFAIILEERIKEGWTEMFLAEFKKELLENNKNNEIKSLFPNTFELLKNIGINNIIKYDELGKSLRKSIIEDFKQFPINIFYFIDSTQVDFFEEIRNNSHYEEIKTCILFVDKLSSTKDLNETLTFIDDTFFNKSKQNRNKKIYQFIHLTKILKQSFENDSKASLIINNLKKDNGYNQIRRTIYTLALIYYHNQDFIDSLISAISPDSLKNKFANELNIIKELSTNLDTIYNNEYKNNINLIHESVESLDITKINSTILFQEAISNLLKLTNEKVEIRKKFDSAMKKLDSISFEISNKSIVIYELFQNIIKLKDKTSETNSFNPDLVKGYIDVIKGAEKLSEFFGLNVKISSKLKEGFDIYKSLYDKDYSNLIKLTINLSGIVNNDIMISDANLLIKSVRNQIEQKEKLYEEIADLSKKNQLKIDLSNLKDSLELSINAINRYNSLKPLLKYSNFIEGIASARNSQELKNVIESVIDPKGSFYTKQMDCFNISISAYPGINICKEDLSNKIFSSNDYLNTEWNFGISAPLGFDFSWQVPCTIIPNGIYLTLFDLGAVFSYRMADDTSKGLPHEVTFQQIFSPGLYLNWYIKNSLPITISFGASWSPQLRKITAEANVIEPVSFRYGIKICWDIPLITLYRNND